MGTIVIVPQKRIRETAMFLGFLYFCICVCCFVGGYKCEP